MLPSRAMIARRFPDRLGCSACSTSFAIGELMSLCPSCGAPLLVRYDLSPAPELRFEIVARRPDMWRYAEVLPVDEGDEIVTLGEGGTPLLASEQFPNVWIKDESKNP